MNGIKLVNINKSFGREDQILTNFNLEIPSGNFFALLGPSGCGKTTLLRLIAGLEKPDSGEIFLGEKNITHLPINKRKVNTVFQNYALFPHLNVFENIAYGLKIRNFSRDKIKDKVFNVLKSVGMETFYKKSISQLSGGQQQRIALARAIVNEPDVLLLDEPLAALDLKLRERMLVELIELQDQLETTFVYITHDQTEALTVADNMAIMSTGGILEQIGVPQDIYEYPKTSFVANFIGRTNIFSGTLFDSDKDGFWEILIDNLGNFKVLSRQSEEWIRDGAKAKISIRPERLVLSKELLKSKYDNYLEGIVTAIIYHGRSTQYNITLANKQIIQVFEQNDEVEMSEEQEIDYDDLVYIHWQDDAAVLLPS